MKKLSLLIGMLCLCMLPAQSQNYLKQLGNSAKNAAGKAVEKKMGNAISNKLGINKSTPQNNGSQTDGTANADGTYASAPDEGYAARLVPEESESAFNYMLVENLSGGSMTTLTFKTYAEAIAAMPAIPDASELVTESSRAAYRAKLENYQGAVENMRLAYLDAVGRISAMGMKASGTATASTEAQLAQRQAINEALMKLSKEELDKLEKMDEDEILEYLQKNHPDILAALAKGTGSASGDTGLKINEAKADAYDTVLTRLMDFQEEVSAHMFSNMFNDPMQNDFARLRKEILASWKTSAEYAQINRMEAELVRKMNEYDKDNRGKSQDYPSFWSAERRKQNEVIDQWNRKQTEKWLNKIAEWQQKYKAEAEKLTALDSRLEEIRGNDEEDFMYLKAKMTSAMLNDKVTRYVNLSGGVFCVPQILHVQEQPEP